MKKLISVKHLSIAFGNKTEQKTVIENSNFHINSNEILGVVGESGSGKSITALALMGLLPKKNAFINNESSIQFHDEELLHLNEKKWQKIRGKKIAMIFQEPMSALNPSMKCGKQVEELLKTHTSLSKKERKKTTLELFEQVKLPEPEVIYNKYPHQISGGQKQRVIIAIAIACKPELLIADEPTTALDVTVQKEIIQLLKEIQKETQMSILFISHDLALVSEIAQRVLVMYKGNIIEQGTTEQIFKNPKEVYTKALLASRPKENIRLKKLPTIADFMSNQVEMQPISDDERLKSLEKIYNQEPLLEVKNVSKTYITKKHLFKANKTFEALKNINLKIYEGETLGLVGESGCGKSTLGNAILMLDPPSTGQIFYRGMDITSLNPKNLKKLRKEIQLIFQDPFASLNPKKTILETIIEPMRVHNLHGSDAKRKEKVIDILHRVGLSTNDLHRYPHEFSGGQRQRIGIARTIAVNPKLIICDESVSALDISVQAQVLNLLNELKEKFKFTYLFISHDLSVVKYMSDSIAVMNRGEIVEYNEADALYQSPKMPYTQTLIEAIPKGLKD